MLLSATTVLLPVLFVLVIGYWAGRSKKFDADQVNGVNELVLDFALPAIMFVSIVKTTASEAQAESVFLVAMFVGFVGFYLAVLLVSMTLLRHSLGAAALQACSLSFPSVAFMGIPIFKGLFGETSLLSIASATVLANLTIAPLTVVLLEMHAKRVARESVPGEGAFAVLMGDIRDGLVSSIVKPMVWAPLLAVAIVLLGVTVPKEIDDMLLLIGSTTSGVALFAAGLVTAAHRIHFSREVAGNVIVKMIAQPLVMAGLVMLLAVAPPLSREAILMCAIPTSAFATLLAPRYGIYEDEAASTLVMTTLPINVDMPIQISVKG
jgi:predicted permease